MDTIHDFLIAPFAYEFMQRGLAATLLLGVSGGILGVFLLLRRLSLMGDALAHSLLPGIGLAFLLFGPNPFALFGGALIAGLLTSAGSALVTALTRIKEEAAFAVLFIVLFSAGIALVSFMGTRINLLHFLFGNVLGVTESDLWLAAFSSVLTVSTFLLFYRCLILESFDPVFYRAIGGRGTVLHLCILGLVVVNLVAALQAMGAVLALGLFILPAATAYLWSDRLGVLLAISVGSAVFGAVTGLLWSFHTGVASGAAIVLALGVWFLITAVVSPRYGMAVKLVRTIREGRGVTRAQE